MNKSLKDTITAVATAPGKSAVAVIRLSGQESLNIADKLFAGRKKLTLLPAGRMTLGHVVQPKSKQIIDKALFVVFRKPYSFTGENMIEISCHGGPLIVQTILSLLLENGARLAEPGEFTKRAFLNGKMDLLQAESVADIIDARTNYSLLQSQNQLSGLLSERLIHFKEKLKRQLALLEIELDFAEEDIEFASRDELIANADDLLAEVEKLIDSYSLGKVLRDGVNIALIGRPNVGKSSILNRLLDEDRAIVSDAPGTTRDVIEEALDINGVLYKVSDSAGLRFTDDVIEQMGVTRSMDISAKADIILFIVESGASFTKADYDAFSMIKSSAENKIVFLMINKIDLACPNMAISEESYFKEICKISAKTGEGFPEFKKKLSRQFIANGIEADYAFINKLRHKEALIRTRKALQHAKESIRRNLSSEYISLDVRSALDALGEVSGEVTTEDILNDIFSSFCIGK